MNRTGVPRNPQSRSLQLSALAWVLIMMPVVTGARADYRAQATAVESLRVPEPLELAVGMGATIHLRNIESVEVEDDSVVQATRVDRRNVVVRGKAAGSTIVLIRTDDERPQAFRVLVSAEISENSSDTASISQAVREPAVSAKPRGPTELYVGSVSTLQLGSVSRIVVGNDAVIQASMLDNGDVLVLGKSAGVSELSVWTEDETRQQYVIRVYPGPPGDTASLLRAVFESFPDVVLRQKLGTVILTGTVDAGGFERFEKLVQGLPNVVSLVTPQLNIAIEQSIALDVRVLEVNRSYQRTVGVKWQDTGPGPAVGVVGNLVPNNLFGVVSDGGEEEDLLDLLGVVGSGTQRLSGYLGITSIIGSELQLLQDEGLARVLAEPSLSTVSGEKATFLAGGDLPITIVNEFGQPVVEFRQYGIQLEIQPFADRFQNIRSKIRAEVSSVDFATQINGVPGLLRRETTSTITARPGETIVISGLLDARDSRSADKLPGLADIPIIGSLFRSDDFQRQRTELVVTVTPRIQKPNQPLGEELQKADSHLRKVLVGSDKLNDELFQ